MTPDEMIAAVRGLSTWIRTHGNINRDDAIDECARAVMNLADSLALRSRPVPPDDLVRAVEAVLDHDAQHDTLYGTGLAEMLRAALAAPAPVAAPAPEPGQCGLCGERDGQHGQWCQMRKPAPETPAPDAMPYCRECGADDKRMAYVEAHADSDEWRCRDCGHTFPWRRQESQP